MSNFISNLSLKWKTALPIIIFVALGVLMTVFVTGYETQKLVFDQERQSTLHGYRDTVLNALTTMMVGGGNFNQQESDFLAGMKDIGDIQVIRGQGVTGQYGVGNGSASPDSVDEDVLNSGKEKVVVDGDYIRGVYPYVAVSNYMGRNCLSCHSVGEGAVLGAVSIQVPIKSSLSRIRSLQLLFGILGILGILAAGGITLIIVQRTHKPLERLVEEMKAMAAKQSGTAEDDEKEGDEIIRLSNGVDGIIRVTNEMVNNIMLSTGKILPVIDILEGMAEKTADGARKQSSQAIQIAAASEEMSQTISEIAKNTAQAAETSGETMDIAMGGEEVANGAVDTVNNVFTSTVELAGVIGRLNGRVEEIGGIVTVIKDIADQTNLLALNAAIEAARAGDQGRGFAVVADEVRKLAEKTIRATVEISEKIESVQAESGQTVKSMEGAKEEVEKAKKFIEHVGSSLKSIVEAAQKVRDQITNISTAVDEQSATSADVSKNIEQTSEIAHGIEGLSGNVLEEVKTLAKIAGELRTATSSVRTKGGAAIMMELAKNDHSVFVRKIADCLSGKISMDASQLPDHHTCRFGQWYHKEGIEICGGMNGFRQLEGPHELVHRLAKEALSAHAAGNKETAERAFHELERTSGQMIQMLEKLRGECSL